MKIDNNNFSFLDFLPEEGQVEILKNCDIPGIANMALVSTRSNNLAHDFQVWKRFKEIIGEQPLPTDNYETIKDRILDINQKATEYKNSSIHSRKKIPITLENTQKSLKKINLINAKDTIKVWEAIINQNRATDLTYPCFTEDQLENNPLDIIQQFDDWIDQNKDNIIIRKNQKLDLSNLWLKHLPKSLCKLTQLTILKLSFNRLTHLPSEIGNLTQLQILDLSHNNLIDLPPEISNLTQLQGLGLSHNNLTQLPPQISNLTQLLKLNLSHNKLTRLPSDINNLTQLQKLNLSHNNLIQLPHEIGNLTQLEKLKIKNNPLKSYQDCLDHLYDQGTNIDFPIYSHSISHMFRKNISFLIHKLIGN